jgi:hypothetical protein
MLRYFAENYSWSQSVNICLSGGGHIHEIDEACAPLKEISKQKDEAAESAWYDSWMQLAGRVERNALEDEKAGHPLSAGRKFLRSAIYYIMAERMMDNRDARKAEGYKKVLSTFKKGVQLSRHPVEFVTFLTRTRRSPVFSSRLPETSAHPASFTSTVLTG